MGRDYTPTLDHYLTAFRIETTDLGVYFSGSAWNSFFATMKVAALSAPLTAAIGLLTAYLLTRQRFAGQRAFEFGTLLSFAIPGTVVGVSLHPRLQRAADRDHRHGLHPRHVLRVPQHAGRRALRHRHLEPDRQEPRRGVADARRALLAPPCAASCCRCCGPAIVASLVYSFVRAMTAVSAVIFLVTAEYNMATDLYRRPRRGRGIRPRHRLFDCAHHRDAGRHHRRSSWPSASGVSDVAPPPQCPRPRVQAAPMNPMSPSRYPPHRPVEQAGGLGRIPQRQQTLWRGHRRRRRVVHHRARASW